MVDGAIWQLVSVLALLNTKLGPPVLRQNLSSHRVARKDCVCHVSQKTIHLREHQRVCMSVSWIETALRNHIHTVFKDAHLVSGHTDGFGASVRSHVESFVLREYCVLSASIRGHLA